MSKRGVVSAAALCALLTAEGSFRKISGIDDVRIQRVAVSKADPSLITVASDNTLYVSSDSGHTFNKAAVLMDEQIRHVFIDHSASDTIYMAGTRHAYRVNHGTTRIFSADIDERINFIIKHDGHLYVATSEGLYATGETLLNWQSVPGLQGSEVFSVTGFGDCVYTAGDKGVFLLKSTESLLRLFTTRGTDRDGGLQPRRITVDALTPNRLWLATNKGVFLSPDRGESWRKFYIAGADNVSINCIAQPPLAHNLLYLCTDSGFFKVNISKGSAEPLTAGLPTTFIRWMDFSSPNHIYLATARGLFESGDAKPSRKTDLYEILKGEPSIKQVQAAALLYNSVDPDKTENWRKRLKYRALFPKVSLDYDKTIGYSVSSSGKYFGVGPYDWGVSLSWDMGNLLWNSYEDDVDNRSRLTTQLRMDILDEVNRLYYERLRLKTEIMLADRDGENTALNELRLLELTATLDGYTGGIYSRR